MFAKTAAYGHFGRDDRDFTWERTDKAEALRAAAGVAAAAAASPAASRSACALSTRSHEKSWSSRPKWPYAAVFA